MSKKIKYPIQWSIFISGIAFYFIVLTNFPNKRTSSSLVTSPISSRIKSHLPALTEPDSLVDYAHYIRGGTAVNVNEISNLIFDRNITTNAKIDFIRKNHGRKLETEEKSKCLNFLRYIDVPAEIGPRSRQWLSDELLTLLRLQNPPSDDIVQDLTLLSSDPRTDPTIRDYAIQHLGQLWDIAHMRNEVEDTLWKSVNSKSDLAATALVALYHGYQRDSNYKQTLAVRDVAFSQAERTDVSVSHRVTWLAIVADENSGRGRTLASNILSNPDTPKILEIVAKRMLSDQ